MADRMNAGRGASPKEPGPADVRPRERKGYAGPDPERREQAAPRTKASPARLAALEVVRLVRERGAFAHDLIAKHIDSSDLEPEDRAFATRLVLGVVSAQGTLDEVVDRALRSPSDIQPDVRDALRLGAYEIIFLEKSPHAAVDQGVELVRSFAPRATGLANAVLRKIVELKRSFPFGDPARDMQALARLHAFPAWLASRLVDELGPRDAAEFMRASNEPAPLFVAVNAAKARDEAVEAAFAKAGERLERAGVGEELVPGCFLVPDGRSLLVPEVRRLLAQGRMLVSDAASQLVAASVLPAAKSASLLEIGAGRATKTILLQSGACRRYGSQIEEHVTLDNRAFKTKLLLDRAKQYGVSVSQALTGDALDLDAVVPNREFDVVFIDAPCSGLGTLRRHPEIRWRMEPEAVPAFARTQVALLEAAAPHVAPGGTLAYATCTVTSEENIGVVKSFLSGARGERFKLAPIAGRSCIATRLFAGSSDAHFAVRLVREP